MPPELHLVCGKVAAGKSTLCADLSKRTRTVGLSEDQWLAQIYPDEMHTLKDHVRCAARLERVIAPLVTELLRTGTHVVMDFQANTVERRGWLFGLAQPASARAVLHVLETPDALCLERLKARNAAGTHPFQVSEAQFHQLSRHYVAPSTDEGFEIIRHHPA